MSSALRTPLTFAIIGHPIAHALSPAMRHAAFRALGLPHRYDAIASSLENAALLVNATPIGMFPDTDRSPLPGGIALRANLLVSDLIYRPIRTSLIRQAESDGCRTIGGTEMLIHQGAAAFTLWTGQTMPVEPVRQALAQHLSPAGSNRLSSLE